VPVGDSGGEQLMTTLHRHLLEGVRPAVALARAQAATDDATSRSYVCFGGL